MSAVYADRDTIQGGAGIRFIVVGFCAPFQTPGITEFVKAFEKNAPNVEATAVAARISDVLPIQTSLEVLATVRVAADAGTVRAQVVNAVNSLNGSVFPVVGCTGLRLMDGAIYSVSGVGGPVGTGKECGWFDKLRGAEGCGSAIGWPTAIAIIGVAVIAMAALFGVRQVREVTGV